MAEYIDIAQAKTRSGLRLVLPPGRPNPCGFVTHGRAEDIRQQQRGGLIPLWRGSYLKGSDRIRTMGFPQK